MSSADNVSSLLIDHHELAVELLRRLDLRCIQPRTTALVFAQVTAVTARGHQFTGRLGMILRALLQQGQFGSERDQQLRPTRALTLRLLRVEAQHVALAVADPDLFDLQVVGDLFVAAWVLSAPHPRYRAPGASAPPECLKRLYFAFQVEVEHFRSKSNINRTQIERSRPDYSFGR
jgi:hypothetical protein